MKCVKCGKTMKEGVMLIQPLVYNVVSEKNPCCIPCFKKL